MTRNYTCPCCGNRVLTVKVGERRNCPICLATPRDQMIAGLAAIEKVLAR